MKNTINSIDAQGNVKVVQTSALYAKYIIDGKENTTIKLTQKTDLSKPPLPLKFSKRTALVDNYTNLLTATTLLHIQGEVGTGKTQLCNLISFKDNIFWFRMREYKERVKDLLTEIRNVILTNQEFFSFKFLTKRLTIPHSSLLVFDDLPNLNEIKINIEFIELLEICKEFNIKVISSSNYQLPINIQQYTELVSCTRINGFSDEDTEELLKEYSAPQHIINMAKLINLFSNEHPSLVIATVNYLKSENWKINFDSFFENKFIENEVENFKLIFNKTIEDNQSKELVYRMNIIGRTVTKDEIRVISAITPSIEHPFDKLDLLLNSWVFKESDNEYLLSPLIYKLGSDNLNPNVERKINFLLGSKIFEKKSVTPFEATKGINYLIKAKEVNTAGFSLFQILYSMSSITDLQESEIFYLHKYWSTSDLPVDMEPNIQLILRAAQIIINYKFGNNIDKLYEDYLKLESIVKEETPSMLTMSYMLFAQYTFKGFTYAIKLNQLVTDLPIPEQKQLGLNKEVEGLPYDSAFILNFIGITSYKDFESWTKLLRQISTEKLQKIFESNIFTDSIFTIQSIINKNIIKGQNSDYLTKLFNLITELIDFAEHNSISNLKTMLFGIYVDCLIEENKLDEANSIVLDFFSKTKDNDAKLIVNYQLAMTYVDKKEYQKALVLYKHVISAETSLYKETLVDAWTYSGISFSSLGDLENAKKYFEKAINCYSSIETYDELLYLKLYGEYSIILWNSNLYHEAIIGCEKILLALASDNLRKDDLWKTTQVMIGHNLGYYYSMLTTGSPPHELENCEEYFVPYSGTFIYSNKETSGLYDIEKEFLLYYQLYNLFYQLNNSEKGKKNLYRAYELANKSTLDDLKYLLLLDFYILENRYEDYFTLVKSIMKSSNQDAMAMYSFISLIKLVNEYINKVDELLKYKQVFIQSFSDVLDKKYFDVIVFTLDTLIGTETDIVIESNWLTQRIYGLTEVYNSNCKRVIEIHNVFYNDFLMSNPYRCSGLIQYEIIEKYFFSYWINKTTKEGHLFKYVTSLLERIHEVQDEKENPKGKVEKLLVLIDRYLK